MASARRDVLITGIGLLSTLGEGLDAHWQRLGEAAPTADASSFAPYVVHPLAPVDFDRQIPKRGDQRTMEPWQRIGTYAAGLAIDSAGLKGNQEILSAMDMIVAAGGGERDFAVDGAILTGLQSAEKPEEFLNERLMNDLRPTLFLAQLSNLLAGNISIVHGVTGSSRTFMGEEGGGVEAIRVAHARIAAGESEIALAGGSYNAERRDLLLEREFAGFNLKGAFAPVWDRDANPGLASGSMGSFLVLESRAHAQARGAKALARLAAVVSDRSPRRRPGDLPASLTRLWQRLAAKAGSTAIISGASGAEPSLSGEREFLGQHGEVPVRAAATHVGHGFEAQFPAMVALATLTLLHGRLFPPADASGLERPTDMAIRQVVATGVGHWRGEGMALVEAV